MVVFHSSQTDQMEAIRNLLCDNLTSFRKDLDHLKTQVATVEARSAAPPGSATEKKSKRQKKRRHRESSSSSSTASASDSSGSSDGESPTTAALRAELERRRHQRKNKSKKNKSNKNRRTPTAPPVNVTYNVVPPLAGPTGAAGPWAPWGQNHSIRWPQ